MGLLYGIELCGASLHCVFIYYAALCCTFFTLRLLHVAVL